LTAAAIEARSQPRGWWGMVLFLAGEATLLSCLIGSYWYLRFKSPHWPPHGIPEPKVLLPLVLTAVLVATSIPVQLAYRAARSGRLSGARGFLALALLVQAAYFGVQIHLFLRDLHEFQPQQHAYASIYYVLVGAGHAHVAVGLLIDAFLLAKLVGGLTRYRLVGLQTTALYWHVVNAFSVLLVLTQVSPAL
jgi:heme/copper-type cytochrome/quinol oxidase subunit 3